MAATDLVKAFLPCLEALEERATPNLSSPYGHLALPRHYAHIRIAELAYNDFMVGPAEQQLLRTSVDLVITNRPGISDALFQAAPNTPQLIYTNTSSVYKNLLTGWLTYADQHGLPREGAFFHVKQPTPFAGTSPSSMPVNWFWGVYHSGKNWTDLTRNARGGGAAGVAFGAAGEALYVGYPEKFREIDLSHLSGAGPGWSAVLEYPTAVNSAGQPSAWAALAPLTNTTAGYSHSGQVTFDPPANWKPVSVGPAAAPSPRLYYVRFRTIRDGIAPVAGAILGRDYVQAHGAASGIIPAFDPLADVNHDGYLNEVEYAHRRSGMDARFLYESRAFAGSYGQMRFAANAGNPGFRQWAVDFNNQLLRSNPHALGLFMDNSQGTPLVDPGKVLESVSGFASGYAALLKDLDRAIGRHLILANTAGASNNSADPIISSVQGYFEEFALRPLAQDDEQFIRLAAQFAHRAQEKSPAPYAILDSRPDGGSPTDPRTQLATLAEYYLLEDPKTTFLDFFGGAETSTSWKRHWCQATAFDVGQPRGGWSLFAQGLDPSNSALTYRVYQRSFDHALVLYRPLSHGARGARGELGHGSAVTFSLQGAYHLLQADGTMGPPITSVTLRNGEGAILVQVQP